MKNKLRLFLTTLGFLAVAQAGWAHAFLDHADPAVGSKVHGSPRVVKLWFTEKLEAALCKLQVFNESGQEVDKRDQASSAGDPASLTVSLPPLQSGKYKVVWRAVSVDTHVTKGDFQFEVSP
ncbi:MAG: copper resistance protein CopC [Verrucomicrobia bacterium]|nr:copper resistance protein CopC [Verrucomicrobiota bacterium]MBV8377122.1 copper resistance protein CopC [Verrucomicrobiota bacterium]